MRDQRIDEPCPDDPWADHRTILDLLVESYPTHWSIAELARATCSGATARGGEEPSTAAVEDALAELFGACLVHRSGHFVFASRAAFQGARLRP